MYHVRVRARAVIERDVFLAISCFPLPSVRHPLLVHDCHSVTSLREKCSFPSFTSGESRNRYSRSCPSALHESEENITISSSLSNLFFHLSFFHIIHCPFLPNLPPSLLDIHELLFIRWPKVTEMGVKEAILFRSSFLLSDSPSCVIGVDT